MLAVFILCEPGVLCGFLLFFRHSIWKKYEISFQGLNAFEDSRIFVMGVGSSGCRKYWV
jgi:hypothetical protein